MSNEQETDTIKLPEPGVHYDVPFEEYKAWDAANVSLLNRMESRSPLHARHEKDNPKSPTAALIEGTAIHKLILEPHEFYDEYKVAPQCGAIKKSSGERCTNKATRMLADGSQYLCGVHAKGLPTVEIPANHCIASEDFVRWKNIAKAVKNHSLANKLIESASHTEVSLLWMDEQTGLPCKARLDALMTGLNMLGDLKTTEDAGEDFARSVHKYSYYRQAAWYLRGAQTCGLDVDAFAFIAIEKQPPHDVVVYQTPERLTNIGNQELDGMMRKYAEVYDSGEWSGYSPTEVVWLDLPEWRNRQIERQAQ